MYQAQEGKPVDAKLVQVSGELTDLENAINDAEKSLACLADRTQPVCRNDQPRAEKDGPKEVQALVPLADRIHNSVLRVRSLSSFMTNILSRMEI